MFTRPPALKASASLALAREGLNRIIQTRKKWVSMLHFIWLMLCQVNGCNWFLPRSRYNMLSLLLQNFKHIRHIGSYCNLHKLHYIVWRDLSCFGLSDVWSIVTWIKSRMSMYSLYSTFHQQGDDINSFYSSVYHVEVTSSIVATSLVDTAPVFSSHELLLHQTWTYQAWPRLVKQ